MLQVSEEDILPFYFTFHSGLLQLPDLKIGLINLEYKNISQVFRWQDFFPSTWNPPGSKKNLGQMEKWLREFNWHWASRDWRKTLFGAHAAEVNWEQQEFSLNSLSFCWPSTSIPSSAPHRHQHSLLGSCSARHGHRAWDVQHHYSQNDTLPPWAG